MTWEKIAETGKEPAQTDLKSATVIYYIYDTTSGIGNDDNDDDDNDDDDSRPQVWVHAKQRPNVAKEHGKYLADDTL